MIIRLLSTEIPDHWELIKFCATKADVVDEKDLRRYLNKLLHSLLNDKAQCWMRLDEETRKVLGVAITKITASNTTGDKELSVTCVYSFRKVPDSVWQKGLALVLELARKENCAGPVLRLRNKRLCEMAKSQGFKERHTTLVYTGGI